MNNENLAKWELIKNLDLRSVKEALKFKKGFWWRWKNSPDKLEAEYRQFLYLAAINPTEVVVPWTQPLDDFWHEHILDTAKYKKDCEAIFGKMFHHNPNLPVGTPEQSKAFKKTKEMYKESFGQKAKSTDPGCAKKDSSSSPGCAGTFIPVFCGGDSSDCHHSSHDSHSSSDCGHSSDAGSHSSCGGHSSCSSCSGGSSCGSGGGGCGGGGGD